MDISVFKTFLLVAKTKSVSKTGEKVYLTQPAVSKQIKTLEDLYGVKLFERNRKEMILTEAGKQFLNYARKILSLYDELTRSFNERDGKVTGILKMGVNLTLGIYILPKLIRAYSKAYPDLKIDMILDNTDNVIQAVKRHDVNFGFIGIDLDDALITQHLLYQDPIIVVVGPDLPIKKRTVSWKELESLPFIGRERGSDIRETIEPWLKARNIELKSKIELNNTEAIKQCIQLGMGFSLLPLCTVEQEMQKGLLLQVTPPYLDIVQNYYVCHYKHKRFSRPERVFLEFLFQNLESGNLISML